MNKILVLCIGNICRSPIAQAMLQERLLSQKSLISVSSAGLHAMVGLPADPTAQELMRERGIDISTHRARQFTQEIAFDADLVLTMDTEQQEQVENQLSSMRGRVHRIGKIGGFDVPDPYKRPRIIFEQALTLIEQGINEWYKMLWN